MTALYLALAIAFEVGWAISMKASPSLTWSLATARTFILYILSIVFLTLAVRKMELSVAYAIWVGVGTVLICIIAIWKFNESFGFLKIASIGLIVAGVVGIHLADKAREADAAKKNPIVRSD